MLDASDWNSLAGFGREGVKGLMGGKRQLVPTLEQSNGPALMHPPYVAICRLRRPLHRWWMHTRPPAGRSIPATHIDAMQAIYHLRMSLNLVDRDVIPEPDNVRIGDVR
jgi:hypothetical protein